MDEESKGLDKFERILEEGPRARELLITSNMGLVRHVVETVLSSYYHIPQHSTSKHTPRTLTSGTAGKKLLYSLTRQDLIQEGAIGLARAIDKYDATLASSAAFSTYAFYWIRAAVLRAIAQKDELVRVPEHVTSAITKIVRATHRLGLSNSDSAQALQQDMLEQYHSLTHTLPIRLYTTKGGGVDSSKWEEAETAKRLADEAGVSLSLLKDALMIQHRRQVNHRLGGALSLEPWMTSSSSSSITTTAAEPGDSQVHDDPKVDFLKESLSKHVSSKEMEALCLRYGLIQPKQQPGFRDYEAEAEVELFGESSYSVSSTSIVNQESHKIESKQKLAPLPIGGRWGEAMSFAEIGKQMQVSAEYGRRLCSSALKKLKHAAEEGRLDPALLYI
jgi:RNA polymerase sigma factor (sigma-70 family)